MNAQQLKNSILQMAVQGKLVPQDPNDEPASILLERIRKEKEQLIKDGKIKKDNNPSFIFRGSDNLPYEKVGKNEPVCIANEIPFEIPDSWEWCRFGFISNYAETKKKIKASEAPKEMWLLDLEDIEKGGHIIQRRTIGERNSNGEKTFFYKGNILYSKLRPYLLKILVAPDDGICTSEIVPFKVYGNILSKYIVLYLKSPYVDTLINNITYGIKMPRVGTDTMINLLIPIPPLPEQNRIVNLIQTLIEYVNKYDIAENDLLELNIKFPEQLKKSILNEAVQGKLVPQDPNDEPASVLLERIRKEKEQLIKEGEIKRDKHESVIYRRDNSYYEKTADGRVQCIDDEIPFEIPDRWEWITLKMIATNELGKTLDKAKNTGKLVPYLCSINVYWDGIDLSTIKKAKFTPNDLEKYRLEYGDLLICEGGDYGRSAIWEFSDEMYYQNALHRVRFFGGIYPYYFQQVMNFYKENKILENHITGMTINHLVQSELNKIYFPLPPLNEQKRIVERIKEISSLLKNL